MLQTFVVIHRAGQKQSDSRYERHMAISTGVIGIRMEPCGGARHEAYFSKRPVESATPCIVTVSYVNEQEFYEGNFCSEHCSTNTETCLGQETSRGCYS